MRFERLSHSILVEMLLNYLPSSEELCILSLVSSFWQQEIEQLTFTEFVAKARVNQIVASERPKAPICPSHGGASAWKELLRNLDRMQLFVWGRTSNHRLGIGISAEVVNIYEPTKSYDMPPLSVSNCMIGKCHEHMGIAVDAHGRLVSWGQGDSGRLGHGNLDDQPLPRCVPIDLGNESGQERIPQIVQASTGHCHSIIRTDDGQLFWSGLAVGLEHTQEQIQQNATYTRCQLPRSMKVTSAAALSFDTVALCEDGKIYSTGRFQFARADDERTFIEIPVNRGVPKNADQANIATHQQGSERGHTREALQCVGGRRCDGGGGSSSGDDGDDEDTLVELYPGYSTVYAVTRGRELFRSFLDGDPDEHNRMIPDHTGLFERPNISMERVLMPEEDLSGMGAHARRAENSLYSFPGQSLPRSRIRVHSLSASNYHTALVSECGRVLTWGHGQKGQLGHGDRLDRPSPTVVEFVQQWAMTPVQVSCGADYEGVCVYQHANCNCTMLVCPPAGRQHSPIRSIARSFVCVSVSNCSHADGGHSALMHSQCTRYALHSLCTHYALTMHSLCTHYALTMHSLCTLYRWRAFRPSLERGCALHLWRRCEW
jgi:alpha-tubulin suppressor-like RCC1 family protein